MKIVPGGRGGEGIVADPRYHLTIAAAMRELENYAKALPSDRLVYTRRFHTMTTATWADLIHYVGFKPEYRVVIITALIHDEIYWWDKRRDTGSALRKELLGSYLGEIVYWPVFS